MTESGSASSPNIVVLAGGLSSRMKKNIDPSLSAPLRSEASAKSKSMIGVGSHSRPFLDYLLWNIREAGYRDVVIVVRERGSAVRRYYEEEKHAGEFLPLRFSYVVQPIPPNRSKPLGTADALGHALAATDRWRGQKFTVCNSDNLYSVPSLKLLLHDMHPNAMIDYDRNGLRFSADRIAQFSVIQKDPEGYLTNIIEKPTQAQVKMASDHLGRIGVSMNIFRFSFDEILPYLSAVPLHPVRNEKELPLAVKLMVEQKPKSVYTIPLSEHVIDLTTQSDIPEVQKYLRNAYPHSFSSPQKIR